MVRIEPKERKIMSILFEPINLGNMHIDNRFVRSATSECMANGEGKVTKELINLYSNLSKGGVGLIITGFLFVHPLGRAGKYQIGIHRDDLVTGLKELVDAVHQEGSKIAFQLNHAGRQTTKAIIGVNPLGPSAKGRDPVNFVKPTQMNDEQIHQVIKAFKEAAIRAVESGVDAIQIHAAHGYLINQFISPFFNERTDEWGGSDENRFRFLKSIISAIREAISGRIPLLVKLSTHDHTPQEGVTPKLAMKYAEWLADMNIDAIELSCGSSLYSFMNMCRGEVPVNVFLEGISWPMKPLAKLKLNSLVGKYDLEEGYNLDAAKMIKPVVRSMPIILVGGLRRVSQMEQILEDGYADFISMCRPFIREPSLVNKIKEGKIETVSCDSCNKCFAAAAKEKSLKCYSKGFSS